MMMITGNHASHSSGCSRSPPRLAHSSRALGRRASPIVIPSCVVHRPRPCRGRPARARRTVVPWQVVVRCGRVRCSRAELCKRGSQAGGRLCAREWWETCRAWEPAARRLQDALWDGPSILSAAGGDGEVAERGRKLGSDRRGRGMERGG